MKILSRFLMLALLIAVLGLAGCGDDGSDGAAGLSAYEIAVNNGFTGTEQEWLDSMEAATAAVEPESCATCHDGESPRSGDAHQAAYDELFQQDVVVVTNVAYANDGTNDIVTFDMTKNGAPFYFTEADSLSIVFPEYIAASAPFELGAPGFNYSLAGTITNPGGTCTSTKAQGAKGDLSGLDGVVVVYGNDELVMADPVAHLSLARYPFAAIQELNTVSYASAANVTGCEKCHTTPYFKHGYISGAVGAGTDFLTCKACHLDDLDGGHEDWQYMVDDPMGWATGAAATADYSYKKNLMNDVHMSHAMEFPYPQSMANCATCHEGKLTQTLSDANFTLETCKSCHPVTGGTDTADADGDFAVDTRDLALSNLITLEASGFGHNSVDLTDPTQNCNLCHFDGGIGPVFSDIHTGYDAQIYADVAGAKYADAITVSIDTVDFDDTTNVMTIDVTAAGTAAGVDSADIIPTLMVGLYGWDTKDFIVGPHERDADRNRFLEWGIGDDANPRVTGTVVSPGVWQFTADLTMWADLIADGTVKRAEVAIMPDLDDAAGNQVALNAVSETFDLADNAFDAAFYDAIVDPMKCNNCHDALATTFHSPDRGGSVVVCRMCHITRSGGSHLEGQSRSIDSYVHAVHSFQPFDVDSVDFTDPVEEKHFEEHIGFLFPDFAAINCKACHNDGAFNVPDQSKSMPGLLSATDELSGRTVCGDPEIVTGPAARACGGRHCAVKINEDAAGDLASFNAHIKTFGYRVENDDDDTVLNSIIETIMSIFN